MLESELQKVTKIFVGNETLQRLFVEFEVDFDEISRTLIEDVLFVHNNLLQQETVYVLAENPDCIEALQQITLLGCVGDLDAPGGTLSGKYFNLYSPNFSYYVWFNDGTSIDPFIAAHLPIEVSFTPADTAADIAIATQSAINSIPNFIATVGTVVGVDDHIVTVTNLNVGLADPAVDSNNPYLKTGFSFTVTQYGINLNMSIKNLNLQVSTILGLFPAEIPAPHEDNYRDYISSNRIKYTYLLKWIYYCYKFFNKEQFFFHNLIDHYVPNYDAGIISSKTNLKIYFDGLGILLDTIDQKIEDISNFGDIDTVDDRFLQHIAQLLGYQKEDFTIENISFRELIKNLIEIYKTKGTTYSFTLFFKLLGFDAVIQEYYWDRDSANAESFSSIDRTSYLYYLSTIDPRKRTKEQIEDMSLSKPIQPITTADFVMPKDLRNFGYLQSDYTLDEILGFKNSNLAAEDRFTYFKTNFINFKLIQFYTKQDLTAKDTETILKYVKFLTPIYVSSLVEVVTTPWTDYFELENKESGSLIYEGDPGIPEWVDILLPSLFVTLRDYIPINIMPAPESALVIVNNGSTDDSGSGFADSALPYIYGAVDYGISIIGSQMTPGTVDLSVNKYINIKLDKGRGTKISMLGSAISTYSALLTQMNIHLAPLGAIAIAVGIAPNLDIRVYSNTVGPRSKVLLTTALVDDLFSFFPTTPLGPVDGFAAIRGYQDFGLSIADLINPTGVNPATTYSFYINLDDVDYSEIDVSGPTPAVTTLTQIVDAINNHYDLNYDTNLAIATLTEDISIDSLTTGKTVIAYREITSNSGKLILVNPSGTVYKSGINFSLTDVSDVSVSASRDPSVQRFLVAYNDTVTGLPKWTVYNTEGSKIIIDQVLDSYAVEEIKTVTLSNNRVAIIYTSNAPLGGRVKIVDLNVLSVVIVKDWADISITDFSVETNDTGFVVVGDGAADSYIIFLDENGDFAIGGTKAASTKNLNPAASMHVENVSIKETDNDSLYIAFTDKVDDEGYYVIWGGNGVIEKAKTSFANIILSNVSIVKTLNGNIMKTYQKTHDGNIYHSVYSSSGNLVYKEHEIYNSQTVAEMKALITATGNLVIKGTVPTGIIFIGYNYLGVLAESTPADRLQLNSIFAGDIWDDTIELYAKTSDDGHYFVMDNQIYIFDNFSTHYSLVEGVDFTAERNRFNTFFSVSPNDDLIDLFEESLNFIFTVAIAVSDYPPNAAEKYGFYPQRNGYISRNYDYEAEAKKYKGHYTWHQDISEPVRISDLRVRKEVNWPQWEREGATYDNWSSWVVAVDYFRPSINFESYTGDGVLVVNSAADFNDYRPLPPTGVVIV